MHRRQSVVQDAAAVAAKFDDSDRKAEESRRALAERKEALRKQLLSSSQGSGPKTGTLRQQLEQNMDAPIPTDDSPDFDSEADEPTQHEWHQDQARIEAEMHRQKQEEQEVQRQLQLQRQENELLRQASQSKESAEASKRKELDIMINQELKKLATMEGATQSPGGMKVWAKLRALQLQGKIGDKSQQQPTLLGSALAAAKKLERDKRRALGTFTGEALKHHLEKVAVNPTTPFAKRLATFKTVSKLRQGHDNHALWRLAYSNGEQLLSGFDCMKINDRGKLEPRTVMLGEKCLYVCMRNDIMHPKRVIPITKIVGIIENQFAETQVGIVCAKDEYDLYLNISEGKEHFIASLYLHIETSGRKLRLWHASPTAQFLRLSHSDRGKTLDIPLRKGQHDFLKFHAQRDITEQLMTIGDFCIHFSGACSRPEESVLCLTDFSMLLFAGNPLKIVKRCVIKHLKYLVESKDDIDYITFQSHDPEAQEFEVWIELKPFVLEFFRRVRPDLEIIDLSDHAERMEFEAEKAEFEKELEEEERRQEQTQKDREQTLLREQEEKEAAERETLIAEAVSSAREEMMAEIEEREQDIHRQIAEYEEQQDALRLKEEKEASEILHQLQTQLDEIKKDRELEKQAHDRKQDAWIEERRRQVERDDTLDRMQAGNLNPQSYMQQLQRERDNESHTWEQEKATLEAKVAGLNATLQTGKAHNEAELERKSAGMKAEIEMLQRELEQQKLARVQAYEELTRQRELEKKQQEEVEQKKKAQEAAEIAALMKAEGQDDLHLKTLDDAWEAVKDQRQKRLQEMRRRQREKEDEEKERKRIVAEIKSVEEKKVQLRQAKQDLEAEIETSKRKLAVLMAEHSSCLCNQGSGELVKEHAALVKEREELEHAIEREKQGIIKDRAAQPSRIEEQKRKNEEALLLVAQERDRAMKALEQERLILRNDGTAQDRLAELEDTLVLERDTLEKETARLQEIEDEYDATETLIDSLTNEKSELQTKIDELMLQIQKAHATATPEGMQRALASLEAEKTQTSIALQQEATKVRQLEQEEKERENRREKEAVQRLEHKKTEWERERKALEEELEREQKRARQIEEQIVARDFAAVYSAELADDAEWVREQITQERHSQHLAKAHKAEIQRAEMEQEAKWLEEIVRERQALQATFSPRRLVFSRFRTACYSATEGLTVLTAKSAMNTMACCNLFLQEGLHKWQFRTSTGGIKVGVALHNTTVLSYAGGHSSWVLTRTGECIHDSQTSVILQPVRAGDIVTVLLDFNKCDGALYFGVGNMEPQMAFYGLLAHAPLVPIVELYDKGDTCTVLSYNDGVTA
eukprot:TRINITY_DN2495_c0_g1_i10.p1 TRINITY_DN2495_c0_g1~~TRINITY_DN2495_c0_g1_i10.p1  ORF type:complete len:1327 (-),score=368.47 TRINITY_DN2495_c0_g1_i10:2513-6493(-)